MFYLPANTTDRPIILAVLGTNPWRLSGFLVDKDRVNVLKLVLERDLFLQLCDITNLLELLLPSLVLLILKESPIGIILVKQLELVEHDCHSKVQQKIGAEDHTKYEENGGDIDVVAVLDHYHNLGPAFKGGALEDGEVAWTYAIKVGDSVVEFGLEAISVKVDAWVYGIVVQFTSLVG